MCGEGWAHNRCRANGSGGWLQARLWLAVPSPSAPGPVITTYPGQWAREIPCVGRAVARVLAQPPEGPKGTVRWASWLTFQARFPALGLPQARTGWGRGSQASGWTNQSASQARPLGSATNFLLGPLRPRGASKSFLLPPLLTSLLIHTGTEAPIGPSRSPLHTCSQRRPSKLWVGPHRSPAESDPPVLWESILKSSSVLPGLLSYLLHLPHPSSHAGFLCA